MRSFHNVHLNDNVLSAYVATEKFRWSDFDPEVKLEPELPGEPDGIEEPGTMTEPAEPEINEPESPENTTPAGMNAQDLERFEKEAYQRGFEAGKNQRQEQAVLEMEQETESLMKLLESTIQELRKEKESFYQENEFYIVKLAIEIAKRIIQTELSQNPEILLYVVREALKRISDKGRIVIQTHPDDLALLHNNHDFMKKHLIVFEHVDFIATEKVRRGGCLIESESGIVDAQLDVQLEKIEQSLLEGINA